MSDRSVVHNTFVIERTFNAPPAKVFRAFADPTVKSRWFNAPEEWGNDKQTMDFRVGGKESSIGGPPGGPVISMFATYQDIVPNERIVFTYELLAGDKRFSVSLVTVEFAAEGDGTALRYTEQGAHLDGVDTPEGREHGSRALMDALAKVVEEDAEVAFPVH